VLVPIKQTDTIMHNATMISKYTTIDQSEMPFDHTMQTFEAQRLEVSKGREIWYLRDVVERKVSNLSAQSVNLSAQSHQQKMCKKENQSIFEAV
jgi:hypothetical protein